MVLEENMVVADRFRLVRMIGRGGMGSVWQAMHLGLDTPCALKFIEGELANVAEAHARFEREAKAAAQLRSPHVVQIIDHGVWQGRPYIAMELLDGEDLGKRIAQRGGVLSPAEVNTIVQQVCRALTKAHAAGVVHRDLKPDNVFLVRDDDREIVKILDFGVAKKSSQAIDGSNTKTGAMLGTPYYMSPEQAQGIKSVDARSDLWSLAVIVFQCITGRLPFESEALGDLLVKIIVNPVPVPSQHTVAPVPPGFDRWWAKAADRNPEARFQTAKEFADSLQVALGQSSLTEMTDRRARPIGGQTAVLQNAPQFGNTPNPASQQQYAAGLAPSPHTVGMSTPNPAAAPHAPHLMGTPNPAGHPAPHLMGTPNPAGAPHGSAPHVHATTGSGMVNFASTDVPVAPSKKGLPLPLLAAFAALALIGVVGTSVAVVKRSGASGTPTTSATPPSVPTESATATSTASPTAAASATETSPPPSATATEAASAAADPSAKPEATGAKTASIVKPPTKPPSTPPAKPPTTPPAKPPTTPSAKPSGWNAGF